MFILPLKDLMVPVGSRIQLKCVVAGNPTPIIHWMRDGQPIYPDERLGFESVIHIINNYYHFINFF